jgi:hypothetical protein
MESMRVMDEQPAARPPASEARSKSPKASCVSVPIPCSSLRNVGTWPGVTGEFHYIEASQAHCVCTDKTRGCATKHQIAGLKETTGNDPTKAPGYDRLSPDSQEQVRLAFEGEPVSKDFKGIREDLAKDAQRYAKEYTDVSFYKVDVASRASACRGGDCLAKNVKITKGELRLGLSVPFDREHESMVYKHWQCMSAYDLEEVIRRVSEDSFDGHDSLPTEFEETVTETLETGKVVKPPAPKIESRAKPKKARKKAQEDQAVEATEAAVSTVKVEAPEHEAAFQADGVTSPPSPPFVAKKVPSTRKIAGAAVAREPTGDGSTVGVKTEEIEHDDTVKAKGAAAAPKPKAKKTRAKKRPILEVGTSEDELEYVPKKSRSRSTPFKGTIGLT